MTQRSRTSCEEAFRRVDDYLDRELDEQELAGIRQHLELCEGCAREFRFEAAVLAELRTKLRRVAVPPELLARVLSRLEAAKTDEGR